MQIGLDSFASAGLTHNPNSPQGNAKALAQLLERIQHADEVGLEIFGIGEHHRREYLDSAPSVLLAAAAARTKQIRLTSAVTVLSADDPVRVFQQFATLDLLSQGRTEIVVGRGSFTESFPLFGFSFQDYDELFAEKLDLLLAIREKEKISWSGRFRPPLKNQSIYPRPLQNPLPVWLGVGGSPESFIRAGTLGLPLMVAVIGGETQRFAPLVDLYRQAGQAAGHAPEKLKVGLHSLGYVAQTREEALNDFYPGYAQTFTVIGKERGWSPITRPQFEAQSGPLGAFLIGTPQEVSEKILRHSQALGGLSRVTFQMDIAELTHEQLMRSIGLLGEVKRLLAKKKAQPFN